MLTDEKSLRSDIFQLPDEPLAHQILIPAFRQATEVRGGFGWFSSGWIARLAPGLATYLNRVDGGPIRFVVSPELFAHEIEAIEGAVTLSDEDVEARIREVFVSGRPTASALTRHSLEAMAWMLSTGQLKLRIAKPRLGNRYHPKMWWFSDGHNEVLVRGSANATGTGLSTSVEHMDVDVSWNTSKDRFRKGVEILDNFDTGRSQSIEKVWDLSDAIANDIIRTAPPNAPTIEDYQRAVLDDDNPRWAAEEHGSFIATHALPKLTIPSYLNWQQPPYDHQAQAVSAWEGGERPERGVLAMATGAGKTITALIAASRAQDRRPDSPLLIVVSAPTRILVDQWADEIAKFGVVPTALVNDSDRRKLTSALRRLRNGGTHAVIVTNHLVSRPDFHNTVTYEAELRRATTMLIGDEAHTLGAEGFTVNIPEFFDLRLGLSATPERQYDPDGTEAIFEFFGEQVYEFGLAQAIGFCLVPYDYFVHAATLDGDELSEYIGLSNRISKLQHSDDTEEAVKMLRMRRRGIIEVAQSKVSLLQEVLQTRGPDDLHHVLVYASSKKTEQFEQIRELLRDLDIVTRIVTEKETGTSRLDRDLEAFREGRVQVLLAKKVLDEGFNLPEVREAFILASSTVEREWVQRRGRTLRQAVSKEFAVVHDFIVTPPARMLRDYDQAAGRVVVTELDRALAFARHARNALGPDGVYTGLDDIRTALWPDERAQSAVLQEPGDTYVARGVPHGELA